MMRRTTILATSVLLACGGTDSPSNTSIGASFTSSTTAADEGASGTDDNGSTEDGSSDSQSGSGDGDSDADASDSQTGDGDADATAGDGDGDTDASASAGDGDGDSATSAGDGDGDPTTTTTGDGDGDPTTTGDGDGDPTTTGDGDGDPTTTGDGDGDPTTTTGDGDGDDPVPCFEQNPNIEFVPPNLVFVLDKSGSMFGSTIDFGGGNIKSFWQILHETLMEVVTLREDVVKFGGNWFPTVHEAFGVTVFLPESCVVDNVMQVPPALLTADDFLAVLPGATATGSNNMVTPAQSGYDAATTWINGNISGESTALILFMDGVISDGREGGPDCNMPAPFMENTVDTLTANIASNAAAGIPTYVVGFFLTDPTVVDEMNGYAVAGGVEAMGGGFYSATSPAALLAAFDEIAAEVATCDITLDVASPLPDAVEVLIDGTIYTQIDEADCGTMTGWHYIGGDTTLIRLCGVACDEFIDAPETAVVNFYCDAG